MKTKLLAQYFPTGVSLPLASILRVAVFFFLSSARSIPYIGDFSFHSPNFIAMIDVTVVFVVDAVAVAGFDRMRSINALLVFNDINVLKFSITTDIQRTIRQV